MNDQFAFEHGGPVRLKIVTGGGRTRVFYDDDEFAEIERRPGVEQSRWLPDGSELLFKYDLGILGAGEGWHVFRNGHELPGSVGSTQARVNEAVAAFGTVSFISAVAGLLAIFGVGFVRSIGIDGWSLVDAVVMAVVAWRTHRRSFVFAAIGSLLFALGSVRMLMLLANAGGHHSSWPLLIRASLFVAMARALPALWRER
jgi:hypothetical protein